MNDKIEQFVEKNMLLINGKEYVKVDECGIHRFILSSERKLSQWMMVDGIPYIELSVVRQYFIDKGFIGDKNE